MTHPEAMTEAITRIDRLLKRRVNTHLGPGLSLALTTRSGLIATRAYGAANADSEEPVTERTLFQIGSISKHFTAVACLRLQEQGKLDVMAPVIDVLDWFSVRSRFDMPITIHHLLTHTSGLIMMMDCIPSSWAQTWALRNTELGFEPGTKFSYSNVGYNVLQCVIQTVTGRSFDESLRDLVFAPLRMDESYGKISNDLHGRLAKGHRYSTHDDRPVPRPERQTVVNWYELSEGCGSVVTTPTDLAKFLRMELDGGRGDDGRVFLAPETFEALTHPYVEMSGSFPGTAQGYGVLIERSEETNDLRRVIGGGENLGFEAAMYGDVDAGLGVILCANSYDVPWRETRWILDVLLAAAEGKALPNWPHGHSADRMQVGDAAADYAGTYRDGDRFFEIAAVDGRLELSANGKTVPLERIWGDSFVVPHPGFSHAMVSFGRDKGGAVVEAFQLGDWYRNDAYAGPKRYEVPSEWDAYVGHYRAFGVLVGSLKFFVRKDRLICQSFGGHADSQLVDLGGGTFRIGDETSPHRMRFDWIADGKALRCRASDGDFYRVE